LLSFFLFLAGQKGAQNVPANPTIMILIGRRRLSANLCDRETDRSIDRLVQLPKTAVHELICWHCLRVKRTQRSWPLLIRWVASYQHNPENNIELSTCGPLILLLRRPVLRWVRVSASDSAVCPSFFMEVSNDVRRLLYRPRWLKQWK
jgi:hypothetical protein